MVITPIGWIVFGAATAAALASLRGGLRLSAALLGAMAPMSATAAAILPVGGGASLLAATVAAGGFVAAAGICALKGGLRESAAPHPLSAPPAALAFGLFVALALAGGYVLPRLFEGETLVFATERNAVGVVGGALKLPLIPLAPRAGAITQSAYLLSSLAVFLAAIWAFRRRPDAFAAALWGATATTAAFGALDVAGWGGMSFLRTATYQIAEAQSFAGFTRVIGAATEPSTFGGLAAGLAAWHLWRWREDGGGARLIAALAMAAAVAGSLSTTALGALGGALIAFLFASLMKPQASSFPVWFFAGLAAIVAAAGWAALGPGGPALYAALDAMVAGKLLSESGVERTAWASQALVNFHETYGLGAGLGSGKASGWATAILGQTGAPGAALMTAFLAAVFLRRAAREAGPAKAAAATLLAAAFISEARVDLGYLFSLAAAAVVAAPMRRRRFGAMKGASHATVGV